MPFNSSSSPYPGYGRDTRLIIGNGKFQIGETAGNTALEIFYPKSSEFNGSYQMLIGNLTAKNYKQIEGIVYIASKTDGYAVVDGKANTCKMVRIPNSSVTWYTQDPILVNDPSITYLSSFSEFTPDEQKILKSLE